MSNKNEVDEMPTEEITKSKKTDKADDWKKKKIGLPFLKGKVTVLAILIAIGVLVVLLSMFRFDPLHQLRDWIFTESGLQQVTVDVLDEQIIELFNVVSLEIESRNMALNEIIPGGFINPGIITIIWEYDSVVRFGVRDADRIRIRRIGDVVFIDESTVNVEVLNASISNFTRTNSFRSNPFVRYTAQVTDQIFDAQREQEVIALERLGNERNLEMARRNFASNVEAMFHGLNLTVIWE